VTSGSAGLQVTFSAAATVAGDLAPSNSSAQRAIVLTAPAVATLVTNVPPATYPVASAEYQAFQWINAERARCGMGLLAQNPGLDLASADHASYLSKNLDNGNLTSGLTHEQNPAWPGFTGRDGSARAQFRGYPGYASDLISGVGAGNALLGYQVLFGYATFHSLSAQGPAKHVGLGEGRSNKFNADLTVINVGNQGFPTTPSEVVAGSQVVAGDAVVTYPCGGEILLFRSHVPEEPSPLPNVDLTQRGPPITVSVRSLQELKIKEFSLTASGGVSLTGTLLTSTNRQNLPISQAAFIPDAPLPANTNFNVLIRGTNDGQRFEKRFSFTTGN
jgi:hypothetical protein